MKIFATAVPARELRANRDAYMLHNESMMLYNFNALERLAKELIANEKVADAIKIYLFMADGDQSLDGGYLGERLGVCYEKIGDFHAAKYWYGRAVEENPEVRLISVEARKRLSQVTIDPFLGS